MKNFTLMIIGLFFWGGTQMNAQTTIISSTGDGGFETGVDFPANGWTVANYTSNNTNKWFVGTVASGVSLGTRGAYISDNASGATHNYLNTGISRVMFYRDVTFPAGETTITLSYKVKVTGESTWDDVSVFIQNSATVPSVTQPTSSSSSNPSITGTTRLATWSVQTAGTFVTKSHTISASDAGNTSVSTVRRVIFYWENDGSGGSQPPAAIDEISLVSSPPPAPSCAATPVPSNAATSISIFQQLSWAASSGATSYDVYFGTATNPSLSGNVATTTFNPGALLSNTTYYWKVVPKNASGSATGCTEWTFTTGNNVNMATGSITKCSGNFYDSGGSAAAYLDNEDYTLTICPVSPTDKVNVNFSAFSTEAGYDGLMIYNGNSTAAPLISSGAAAGSNATSCPAGAYSGPTSPGSVTSTASDGCLTFRFRSESSGTSTGWTATVACVAPPACPAPTAFGSSGTAGTSTTLAWTESGSATVWDVYRASTSTPVPTSGTVPTYNDVANPYNVTGLTASTTYYFWVRADCGADNTNVSTWVGPITVTTTLDCAAATVLSCVTPVTSGNLAVAGGVYNITTCYFGGTAGKEKLYSFTPTFTGVHQLNITSVNAGSGYVDYFYKNATSGDCSATGWTCITALNATTAATTIGTLTAGVTYYILLDAESAASTANHTFQIICPVACPATVANAATLVTYNSAQANWTLSTGTFILEYGPTSTFGTPGTGAAAGNMNNTVVTVTNDNKLSLTSLLSATGYSYVVRQDCSGSSNGYSLNSAPITFMTSIAPPANDICSGAISLTPGATCVGTAGSTAGATDNNETGDCVIGTENSVWYSFVAAAASQVVTVVGAVGFDPVVSAISACGSATAPTGGSCVDASADAGTETLNLSGLTIGNTYYIQVHDYQGDILPTSTFTICVSLPPSMTYTSSAITQQTGTTGAGSQYQKILLLNIVTANSYNPLSVNQLDFSTAGTPGTSTASELTNARVYYTGSTSTWTDGSTSGTQFGSTAPNPSGPITFAGSQVLSAGNNYFFLVYDLACGAVGPNIDASMLTNGITLSSGGPYTPTTPDPATNRTVTALASYNTVANGSWSNPAIWSCGVPPDGTTSAININHNVVLDADVSIQATVTVLTSKTLDISTNSLTIGGAGTGTQNLVINGTVNVSGSTLNVGTASTGTITSSSITFGSAGALNVSGGTLNVGTGLAANVTTANITVASGASMTVSGSGIVNLGPTGGYSRTLSVTGTLTNSATINVNGNVVLNTPSTFNMTNGNLNIDPNGGSAGSSVASGTAVFAIGTSSSAVTTNVSGGTILINDPPFSGSAYTVVMNTNTNSNWAGSTIQFGGSTGTNTTTATNGFQVDCYVNSGRLMFGNIIVNGGDVSRRVTDINYGINAANTLTVNANSELRINTALSSFAGNIVNDGIISATATLTLQSITGNTAVSSTNVQTFSGVGTWQNLTSSPTANLAGLTVNNTSGTPIILPANLVSGYGSSISSTLTLTNGIITSAYPIVIGTSGTSAGSVVHTNGWLQGTLVRWINAASGSREFPIGTATTKRLAQINFTGTPTAHTLTASFSESDPGSTGLPFATQNITAEYVSPSGYWTIDASVGQTALYTATVNAAGFTKTDGTSPITNLANIRLIKRPTGGSWGTFTSSTTAGPGALSAVGAAGLSGFSQFAIGGTGAALPLELASFTGKTLATTNLLLWETLTEKNVQSHIVERSVDGIHWTEVGRTPGQLDSHSPLKYELEDRTPPAKAFYRLRSVDVDGQENLSNSIVLTRKSDHFGITAAFPSPTSDQVTVQFGSLTEERVTVRVTDFTGRLVLEQQFDAQNGINEVPVQLGSLQAGVYLVSVANANAAAPPVRIVKE